MTEDRAQRAGDFIRRKQAGCDLVKHRSKEVIISLVDQRHTNWSFAQSADCGESPETTTDNDYTRQHQLYLKNRTRLIQMRHDVRLFPNGKVFERVYRDPRSHIA